MTGGKTMDTPSTAEVGQELHYLLNKDLVEHLLDENVRSLCLVEEHKGELLEGKVSVVLKDEHGTVLDYAAIVKANGMQESMLPFIRTLLFPVTNNEDRTDIAFDMVSGGYLQVTFDLKRIHQRGFSQPTTMG
jgi:hypothetical protein